MFLHDHLVGFKGNIQSMKNKGQPSESKQKKGTDVKINKSLV